MGRSSNRPAWNVLERTSVRGAPAFRRASASPQSARLKAGATPAESEFSSAPYFTATFRLTASESYFPLFAVLLAALTVTFTWRGLDSSRFGNVTVSTPFLYSAPIDSGFTVFGSEKLRLN